eukprot:scaffold1146_cov399-Prasinococcus_capsulatus_cf.AAC.74
MTSTVAAQSKLVGSFASPSLPLQRSRRVSKAVRTRISGDRPFHVSAKSSVAPAGQTASKTPHSPSDRRSVARSVVVESEAETAELEENVEIAELAPTDERWTARQTKAMKSYIYRFGVALPATLLCSYLVYGEVEYEELAAAAAAAVQGVGKSGIFLAMDLAWTTITYYWFELWWDVWTPREQVLATAGFFGGTALAMFIRANYFDEVMSIIHLVV